jgi:dsDNA-specific endonuclease/ATPase MutS2
MVFMDELTKKSLDFQYVLNKINIKTPYGKMYKDKMRPFIIGEEEKLMEELEKVETYMVYARDRYLMREIGNILYHIKDLRYTVKRARAGGILSEVELFEIKNFLHLIRDLYRLLNKHHIPLWNDMKVYPMENLEKLLDPEATGISTFYIYDSYSEELQIIRQSKREIEREIKRDKKHFKKIIEEQLNIRLRPDGTLVVSKDDKKLVELIESSNHLIYVSETYLNIKYSLKPTDKTALLERCHLILKDQEEKEENRIKEILSKEIGKNSKGLFKNMASIGKIDFILGKAHFALDMDGVKPKIIKNKSISIIEGRHPRVEERLNSKGLKFTPISLELKEGVTCITGANMGGKTVSLKLVGLLTAMAQYGLMVPAKDMSLGLNQFIKTSIGDLQSTDKGLSTFGGEIKLIQEAVVKSNDRGLILIDELARGTNPEEGYAISKAVVEYLKDKNSITLLTTHYDNIGSTEGIEHLQVIGLSKMDFKRLDKELKIIDEDKIEIINKHMDYRLKKVKNHDQPPKEALNIARMMGLHKEIINLAEKNLKNPQENADNSQM